MEEVGPSLKYATAKVNRTQRGSGGGGFNSGGQGGGSTGGASGQGTAPVDPWATGSPAASNAGGGQQSGPQGGWGNGPSYDEPPF